jgi:predicted ribosomally synthesized peptide with SipW-like signal peptide
MKKIKWIMLALVLCLGLVGGAYAAWSETLVINNTVETAEFDVYWFPSGNCILEHTSDVAAGGWTSGSLPYGNTVSTVDGNILNITLSKVYPGYGSAVHKTLRNDSEIPVEVRLIGNVDQSIADQLEVKVVRVEKANGTTIADPENWFTVGPKESMDLEFKTVVLGNANRGDTDSYDFSWDLQFRQGVGSKAFD